MAEVKLFKFGERLACNDDANPEPSLMGNPIMACVETRQRVCIKCNNVITNKRKGLIYCSARCRGNAATSRHNIKTGKIKKPGVGSGGNQYGKNNHMYKTGIGKYHKLAFDNYDNVCNRCKTDEKLLVHHIDEDRTNNELHNLEILCKRCHQKHHETRDSFGRYTKG
jgi:hypothetical protein